MHPKPIKRSRELIPLSKEHHEGLLFGWKIKQGLRKGTSPEVIAAFIRWFWETDLQAHFRKEELVLAVHLPAGNALVQQMKTEHRQLEDLVQRCCAQKTEPLFLQLANGLHDHIRFEERVLFPFAEKVIPPAEKEAIYQQLAKEKHNSRFENEFWTRQ